MADDIPRVHQVMLSDKAYEIVGCGVASCYAAMRGRTEVAKYLMECFIRHCLEHPEAINEVKEQISPNRLESGT